ncbi:YihY/virulence factor BrkB family protein [Actinomadura sp. KC345]|uniref:YihY/virulence factor BrkB family protein n=1 Tax=Actinomadura sp. KC345 TaxID=2530371 RepID=UPI001052F6B4|nr:YihY/virulence factor BrkB family protein [Actinomadura sp. KC345]TDC47116.1 YihY/virulence factor BrkB family protein [Actinomadura sp. KC345]
MRQVINRVQRRSESLLGQGKDLLRGARDRHPWLAHHIRAFRRYQDRRGDRLAAALTCYAFLSFFPLLALGYALLGYLVGVSDEARRYFVRAIDSLLPGLAGEIHVEQIAQSKTAVGIIGLAALMITGSNWMQMLREGLRDIWGNEPDGDANYVVKRLWDLSVLALLGVILICGMAVTTVTTSATGTVLGWLGLEDVPGAGTGLRMLSLACAITFNTAVFLMLFTRLSGTRAPWRRIIRGALFGAVGFEVLKQVATILLARVTENPVYGTFAVLVGLMVWINLVSRFMLFVAAWTATRVVVLTADAANPDNVADREEVEALRERTRPDDPEREEAPTRTDQDATKTGREETSTGRDETKTVRDETKTGQGKPIKT